MYFLFYLENGMIAMDPTARIDQTEGIAGRDANGNLTCDPSGY